MAVSISALADFQKRENPARDIVRNNEDAPVLKMQRAVRINVPILNVATEQNIFSFCLGFNCILNEERLAQLWDEGSWFQSGAVGLPCRNRDGRAIGCLKGPYRI